METIKTPDFTRLITEVSAITDIDEVHAEAIEKLLKDELNEYYKMLDEYYVEEYHNAIASARNIAYDAGHSDGYADGYDVGYDDGYYESH